MNTMIERVRRMLENEPASIDLPAADALALARELAELDADPAAKAATLFGNMLTGEARFMDVPVNVTDPVLHPRERPTLIQDGTMAALRRDFGYAPDERGGENWTVYQNQTLIVCHPERRPRLYKRGCGGTFYEIDPIP
ncbi:hypothetical protein [Bradyrhizobium sp. 5.13L]